MKKGPLRALFYIFNRTASSAATTAASAIIVGPPAIAHAAAWRVRALARVSKVLGRMVAGMAIAMRARRARWWGGCWVPSRGRHANCS